MSDSEVLEIVRDVFRLHMDSQGVRLLNQNEYFALSAQTMIEHLQNLIKALEEDDHDADERQLLPLNDPKTQLKYLFLKKLLTTCRTARASNSANVVEFQVYITSDASNGPSQLVSSVSLREIKGE